MAQRTEPADSADDFPTPPWATRALLEHVIPHRGPFNGQTCLEPACGAGHMAKPLAEYFGEVRASDAFDYGFGTVSDYLAAPLKAGSVHWVITNPPFRLAEQFIQRSLVVARKGVAILARTVFVESVGRYRNIFQINPPSRFAQFAERAAHGEGSVRSKGQHGYRLCLARLGARCVRWAPSHVGAAVSEDARTGR